MKKILLTLSIAALTIAGGCQKSAQETTEVRAIPTAEQMANAKLGAVLIYADWCGSCKVLDPKVEAVKTGQNFDDTFFLTLDYTDKNIEDFYEAAKAAGVSDPVRTFLDGKVKTGQLLLIDMDDQKVVEVVKKDMSEADIIKTIHQAESDA